MVIGPALAGQLAVSCKSTELKRCSMIEMLIIIIIIRNFVSMTEPAKQRLLTLASVDRLRR